MAAARADHTSTLLEDGRVLVAGGMVENGVFLGSAELFDPRSGSFSSLPAMTAPRVGQSATLLRDGRVLIAGGSAGRHTDESGRWAGNILKSTEFFDPHSSRFTPGPDMGSARSGQEAVLLVSGKILIIGGWTPRDSALRDVELYDAARNRFEAGPALSAPRGSAASVRLKNGNVLICGGAAALHQILSSCELYDVAANAWHAAGSLTVPRYKHDMILLDDGHVLVVGGSDDRDWSNQYDSAEIYDPASGKSAAIARMNSRRFKLPHTSVVLKNGDVLVAGGSEVPEIYSPGKQSFSPVGATYPEPIYYARATRMNDGRVLITGGYNAGTRDRGPVSTTRAWVFTP
jgi:hypothetical protein